MQVIIEESTDAIVFSELQKKLAAFHVYCIREALRQTACPEEQKKQILALTEAGIRSSQL